MRFSVDLGKGRLLGALAVAVSLALFVPGYAQTPPINIPTLNTPQYRSTDMDPFFTAASFSQSQVAWEQIVGQGVIQVAAIWEAAVDAQMRQEVAFITQSDFYNSNAAYQDTILKDLLLQKQSAENNWELAAEASIQNRRVTFLAALSNQQATAISDESKADLSNGANVVGQGQAVDPLQAEWSKQYADSVSAGLQGFQSSLTQLQSDYNDLMSQIAASDTQFQQNKGQIQAYEQTVRDAIAQAATALQGFLQTNGQFYQETCDAQNNCSTNQTLNAQGQQLQTLINTLQQQLAQNAQLSVMAGSISAFVTSQQGAAQTTANNWQSITAGTNTSGAFTEYSNLSYWGNNCYYCSASCQTDSPDFNQCQMDFFNFVYGDNVRSQAHLKYLINGDESAIRSNIQSRGEYRQVTGFSGMDACYGNRCFSQQGVLFAVYTYSIESVDNGDGTTTDFATILAQSGFQGVGNYSWFDQNADHNRQVWEGYANSLNSMVQIWQQNILPAISNWEKQTADYDAGYLAWKNQANALSAQALQNLNLRTDQIVQQRNQWLSQVEDTYRIDLGKWKDLSKTADKNQYAQLAQLAALTSRVPAPPQIDASLGVSATDDFFSKANTALPDASLLQNVSGVVTKTMQGLGNLALATQMNDDAVQARKDYTSQVAAAVDAQQELTGAAQQRGGTFKTQVDALGNVVLTRTISSGKAELRAGGNGENADDYRSVDAMQTVAFIAPPSAKLADTGDLFSGWDTKAVQDQFNTNMNEYSALLEKKNAIDMKLLEEANEQAVRNEQAWQEDAEDKAAEVKEFNQLVQSVAQAMFGGASLGQALTSQLQSRVGEVVGTAMGIPPEIVSALLGGASVKSALKSYADGKVQSAIWGAVGDATNPQIAQLLQQMYSKNKAAKAAKKAQQQQQINTVVTVAALVAAPFTAGASLAVSAAVSAGVAGAQGFAAGGLKGALVGAAGGALDAVVSNATGNSVSVGLSWSPENGFGASATVGYGPAAVGISTTEYGGTTLQADIGLRHGIGLGVTTNTKTGSGSASVGVASADGKSKLGVDMKYDKKNGMSGGVGVKSGNVKASVGYSKSGGLTGFVGGANQMGTLSGGIGYSRASGMAVEGQMGTTATGATKLVVSEKQGATASIESKNATVSYNQKTGYSVTAQIGDLKLAYSKAGGLSGSVELATGTISYSGKGGLNSRLRDNGIKDSTSGLVMTSIEDLAGGLDQIAQANRSAYAAGAAKVDDDARRDRLRALGKNPDTMSPHDLAEFEARLKGSDEGTAGWGSSRTPSDGLLARMGNAAMDFGRSAFLGQISGEQGYVDASGVYRANICFTAGTLVKTPDGMRKIETIRVSDLVMTVDPETGSMFPARVTETFVHNVNNVYRVTYADGTELTTTWNHPFYVRGKGWTEARYLTAGSESVAVNTAPEWRAIPAAYTPGAVSAMDVYGGVRVQDAHRVFTSSVVKVYNIEVEGTHAYLVGERGVLVHNYAGDVSERDFKRVAATVAEQQGRSLGEFIDEGSGVLDRIGQRFANLVSGRGRGFSTDGQVISSADQSHGLIAGYDAAASLGYQLSTTQGAQAELAHGLDDVRRDLTARCGCRDSATGVVDVTRMNEADRIIYETAQASRLNLEYDHSARLAADWKVARVNGATDTPLTPFQKMLLVEDMPSRVNLDDIRINTGGFINEKNRQYNPGHAIAFGETVYSPPTKDNAVYNQFSVLEMGSLAHEVTHLVQTQEMGWVSAFLRYKDEYGTTPGHPKPGMYGTDPFDAGGRPSVTAGTESARSYQGARVTMDNAADMKKELMIERMRRYRDDYGVPLR